MSEVDVRNVVSGMRHGAGSGSGYPPSPGSRAGVCRASVARTDETHRRGTGDLMTEDELLDAFEGQWRAQAQVVSLAAETLDAIQVEQREEALAVLGSRFVRLWPGMAAERLLRRWPAVHVIATTGVAADHYARGTFWPKLTRILNVTDSPQFQTAWGEAFLENLQELGLPAFDNDGGAGSKYVGRILLHAGIPTYCLQDFFSIISSKRRAGMSPARFVAWASTQAAGSGLANVDMPVRRFVQYGNEFAVDVTDRSLELLDAVRAGGQVDDRLLPRRFWSAAQQFQESGGNDGAGNTPARELSTIVRPRLVLDPYGQGLLLRLPPVGEAPDGRAVWVVTLDEEVKRVNTESLWPGSSEPAPQTDVAITRPVRSAAVALAGREHLQFSTMVIDDKEPLLAFGEDGELIPSSLPLPATKTWMLFPGSPDDLQVAGLRAISGESPLPPRWSNFCLVQVDLSDATEVSAAGTTRPVRKFDAARIDTANAVLGVRTSGGLPVLAVPPTVVIPSSMADAIWDVTVHDSDGAVIARRRTDGDEDPNGVWDEVPRPLVGTYTMRVRGPWGRGAARTFAIVEGLSLSSTPSWRRFVDGGLQPCVTKVRAAAGVDLSQQQLQFDVRDRAQTLRVTAQSRSCSLVVSPPHMTVAYQSDESSISPSVRPLTLTSEDVIEHGGELLLDVGAVAEPVLYVIARNRVVQTVTPRLARAGAYRFDLAQIIDTLRVHPQVALALSDVGELVIAMVRPQSLFKGIELENGQLQFRDCVDVEGLTAYVFALRAPWRQPTALPIVNGHAALPDWLIDAGPLRVIARIDDPWVPLPPPEWPQPGQSTVIESDGWVIDADPEEQAVSRFLAGLTPLPHDVENLGWLWTARALMPRLHLGSRIDEVAKDIDAVIYAHPAAALMALSESDVPLELIPNLMVRSGLAWANLADAHENSAPPWTLRGALPAALLSAADSVWSQEEIDAAITICGDAVNGILDGHDPCARVGGLDQFADVLDADPERRDSVVRLAGLVPQGLLSCDSRVLASMDYVGNRRHPHLAWLVTNAHNVLREACTLVRVIDDPATTAALEARFHPTRDRGWQVIPAVSMAFALAGRHASRGHQAAGMWIARQRRPWADLAEVAPQLVTIDLIIAELTVGHREDHVETAL
jgi:hypothetical protein